MSESARVIKRADMGRAVAIDLDDVSSAAPARRIPRKAVMQTGEGPPAETDAPGRRIIRRGVAEVRPTAVDLAPLEFEPSLWQKKKPEPKIILEEKAPEPPTAEEIQAAWESKIEEAAAIARDEGFAAGFSEAQAHFQAQLAEATSCFAADIAGLEKACREHAADAELKMAHLAFELTETILDAPLTREIRTPVEKTLASAIDRAAAAPIDVSLHTGDYLRLQESGAEEQLSSTHSGLRWHPTDDLEQGDWIVDCPVSSSRRLKKELLADLHTQFLGGQPANGNGQ
jgi:flagellar biosynthesis/type III secretory pathway protein FliH